MARRRYHDVIRLTSLSSLPERTDETLTAPPKKPRLSMTSHLPYYSPNWMTSSSRNSITLAIFVACFSSPCLAMKGLLDIDCNVIRNKTLQQGCRLEQARMRCDIAMTQASRPSDGGLHCHPTFDNVMCWPSYVPAGTRVSQPCADYIDGFNPYEKATRYCTPNGTWEIHPNDRIHTPWTDFDNCRKEQSVIDPTLKDNMPIIITISTIGYSVSLAFLIVAMVIMLAFKKLMCQRNIIHLNLFASFSLRAVLALIRYGVFVDGVALPTDIRRREDGSVFFTDGPHWECKLLFSLMHYSLGANYMWIFVEGLYLHNLIFFAVFLQSKTIFRVYILIGWCTPLFFVIIWVLLRIFIHDTLCWNTHVKDLYWILETPIIVSIVVNFLFFLNIIRVLFLKIRDCNTQDPLRYKKLAKSTLVLIPLFGVYYIIFIIMDKYKEPTLVIIHMYSEMILNSFQGTVVSLLFCFMNGEVQGEIKKRWHRHWLRRQSVISGRSSRAFSTTSFLLRDRASVTQTQMTSDISKLHSNGSTPPRSPNRGFWLPNSGSKQPNGDGGDKTANHANSTNSGSGGLYISNGDVAGGGGGGGGGGIARTSSVPQWSSSPNPNPNKGADLPRVASTSKVTFQLVDAPSEATKPQGQQRPSPSLSRSSYCAGNSNKPSMSETDLLLDDVGETRHLLSDHGSTKSNVDHRATKNNNNNNNNNSNSSSNNGPPSFNGLTPRILPYPSSLRKGTAPVVEPLGDSSMKADDDKTIYINGTPFDPRLNNSSDVPLSPLGISEDNGKDKTAFLM